MRNKKKSLDVLQNVIFDRATVKFHKIKNLTYEVTYLNDRAGIIIGDRKSGYWIYDPTALLPRAPGLHAPQIVKSLNELKTLLQSLV